MTLQFSIDLAVKMWMLICYPDSMPLRFKMTGRSFRHQALKLSANGRMLMKVQTQHQDLWTSWYSSRGCSRGLCLSSKSLRNTVDQLTPEEIKIAQDLDPTITPVKAAIEAAKVPVAATHDSSMLL